MRKTLLILIVILQSGFAFCQDKKDEDDKKWPNGIRAGYQWANLVKGDTTADNNMNSFYIGYLRKVKLAPFVRLETGLEYIIAGAEQSSDYKVQLHYIVLPAQLVVKLGLFYGLAGANADFKIYQHMTYGGQKIEVNNDNRAAFFDVAIDAGAGFNFLFLSVEARYYWGLLNIENGWHNRYAQVGLKAHF